MGASFCSLLCVRCFVLVVLLCVCVYVFAGLGLLRVLSSFCFGVVCRVVFASFSSASMVPLHL